MMGIIKIKRIAVTFILFMCVVAAGLTFSKCTISAEGVAQEKFKVTYNVKKKPFGAKSGKDATEAIQKALDMAGKKGKASKRAKVYIPSGTYYISNTLTVYSNTYIQCDKNTKIIKKLKGGKRMLYMLSSTKYGAKAKKGYNNLKNVTVDGGVWDARFIKFNKVSGGSLFFFAHADNIEITNLTLRNNYGTHLLELGGVRNVTVSNSKFYGFKKGPDGDDKEAIQIDVCHNYEILPMGGPFDDTPCKNITIENNEVYNYPRAVGSHTYVKEIYQDNIVIKNNNFHDLSNNAVYAYNYKNLTVSGNTFDKVAAAVVFKTVAIEAKQTIRNRNKGVKAMPLPGRKFNLTITDNVIRTTNKSVASDTTQFGIFVFGTPEKPISGCEISGNTIKSASSGLYFRYVNDSTISNNKVYRLNNTKYSKFVVDAYKFLTCSSCKISGNIADNSSGNMYENGLAFREKCKDITVEDNCIIKAEKHGVGVYDSSASINNNQISAAGQHGIAIVDGANASINGNQISDTGQYGIAILEGTNASIKGNTVSGGSFNGITITQASVSNIDNNKITDNGATGISIQNKSVVGTVSGNELFGNNGKAIAINTSSKVDSVSNNTMLSINCDWELTAIDSTTDVESFKTVKSDSVTPASSNLTGTCQQLLNVYAIINGQKYQATVTKTMFDIPIPQQPAGTDAAIYQEDAKGNKVVVNVKL